MRTWETGCQQPGDGTLKDFGVEFLQDLFSNSVILTVNCDRATRVQTLYVNASGNCAASVLNFLFVYSVIRE